MCIISDLEEPAAFIFSSCPPQFGLIYKNTLCHISETLNLKLQSTSPVIDMITSMLVEPQLTMDLIFIF